MFHVLSPSISVISRQNAISAIELATENRRLTSENRTNSRETYRQNKTRPSRVKFTTLHAKGYHRHRRDRGKTRADSSIRTYLYRVYTYIFIYLYIFILAAWTFPTGLIAHVYTNRTTTITTRERPVSRQSRESRIAFARPLHPGDE